MSESAGSATPPPVMPPAEPGPPSVAARMAFYQRAGGLITPVLTAVFAFFVGGIVVAATGHNPLTTYREIFNGTGLNWFFQVGSHELRLPFTETHVWFPWNVNDAESEALVQDALLRLMQNRTSFVIAHRLSTVRRADAIVVLERGVVREVGRHDELLARPDGVYARLYALQMFEGSVNGGAADGANGDPQTAEPSNVSGATASAGQR